MKAHHIAAALVFLGCTGTASFSSTAIGIAIICSGTFICALFLLYPTIEKLTEKKSKGELTFSPVKGVKISWEVRSDQPIRTVFPEQPTDSTDNEKAKKLCNAARDIVKNKTKDKNVNLSEALEKFKKSADMDEKYWEPRINIAQIYLLTGRLEQAFSEAESIRLVFSNEPLAFAKAGLILARAIEQGISKKDGKGKRKSRYQLIQGILEENIRKCSGHLTSMVSLGRVLALGGANDNEMKTFISDAMQYHGFAKEFKKALKREEMLSTFKEQFPNIL